MSATKIWQFKTHVGEPHLNPKTTQAHLAMLFNRIRELDPEVPDVRPSGSQYLNYNVELGKVWSTSKLSAPVLKTFDDLFDVGHISVVKEHREKRRSAKLSRLISAAEFDKMMEHVIKTHQHIVELESEWRKTVILVQEVRKEIQNA